MQRARPQGPWLQGNHPDHLTGAVGDLHSPTEPLFRRRRGLCPEFLDRLGGVADGCIDVCELETLVVTDNLIPVGQIEIVTGRHGWIDSQGFMFHDGTGRRIEKGETAAVHGFSTYPWCRMIAALAYTCGGHRKDRLDRNNLSANSTRRWDLDDGNAVLDERSSPARPI